MTTDLCIQKLGDEDLLTATRGLVRRSVAVTADLLLHLSEIDARKLYLGRAFSSMFGFCIGELGFSEDVAYNHIQVARVARRESGDELSTRRHTFTKLSNSPRGDPVNVVQPGRLSKPPRPLPQRVCRGIAPDRVRDALINAWLRALRAEDEPPAAACCAPPRFNDGRSVSWRRLVV